MIMFKVSYSKIERTSRVGAFIIGLDFGPVRISCHEFYPSQLVKLYLKELMEFSVFLSKNLALHCIHHVLSFY